MTRRVISVGDAQQVVPLSAAVACRGLLFVSGQVAPEARGIEDQVRAVLSKIGTIRRAANTDYANVVRCGVYLKDISMFAQMNSVYQGFFPDSPPARTTIGCALADPAILVEVDCVAELASSD